MKKELVSENPRRSHLLNVVSLLNPLWWVASLSVLARMGDVLYPEYVDPILSGILVGSTVFSTGLAFMAGCARVIEYHRVLRNLRQNRVLSYFNPMADALYPQLKATRGRRKVLAAALTTLERRPADADLVMHTFITKRYPRFLVNSREWWAATFSPARII